MKNLARVRWFLAIVATVSGASAATIAGCSGDDTSVDTGNDSGSGGDGTTHDVNSSDTTQPPVDGGVSDAPKDQNIPDVETPNLLRYHEQITEQLCAKIAGCCGATTFDLPRCKENFLAGRAPGIGLTGAISPNLDGGKITLDTAKAKQCFIDIANLGCGVLSSQALLKVQEDCLSGVVGTIPAESGGCRASGECIRPNHCDIAPGFEAGTCKPPRNLDQGCDLGIYVPDDASPGDFIQRSNDFYYEPQAQCGFLITGVPRYCANQDTVVGYNNGVNGTNTCKTQVGVDAGCYQPYECQTGICELPPGATGDTVGACATSTVLSSPEICTAYRKADAGG
jgi:hypothetical protein